MPPMRTGRTPAVWAASRQNSAPCSWLMRARRATSYTSPVTLEACVATTRRVSGRNSASKASASMEPSGATGSTESDVPAVRAR